MRNRKRLRLMCLTFLFAFGLEARSHDLSPGLYEILVELELPNIIRPAQVSKSTRCITQSDIEYHDAFRIESDSPLRGCDRLPICMSGSKAGFQVLCTSGVSGFADGIFTMAREQFSGTVRIKLGGKNMTLIERQNGRRVGDCK